MPASKEEKEKARKFGLADGKAGLREDENPYCADHQKVLHRIWDTARFDGECSREIDDED